MARTVSSFNQQINAVEWGSQVNDVYGYFAIRKLKSEMIMRGSSTTLPILSKSKFSKLQIEVPPIEHQSEFSVRVKRINAEIARLNEAIRVSSSLVASLQTRAFRGGL